MFQDIICAMPRRSILGSLLSILHINDLKIISNALNTIVFADDTNLSISVKNIDALGTSWWKPAMETPHKHYRKQNLKKRWANMQSKKMC